MSKVKPLDSIGTANTPTPAPMRLPPHGRGLLRTGNPGNKGKSPDEFKVWMASMASSEQAAAGLRAIIADPTSAMFLGALKHVTEHGYGKPKESKEVTFFTTRKEAAAELAMLLDEAHAIERAD